MGLFFGPAELGVTESTRANSTAADVLGVVGVEVSEQCESTESLMGVVLQVLDGE